MECGRWWVVCGGCGVCGWCVCVRCVCVCVCVTTGALETEVAGCVVRVGDGEVVRCGVGECVGGSGVWLAGARRVKRLSGDGVSVEGGGEAWGGW